MAALSQQNLDEVQADIMRRWSQDRTAVPITKPELGQLLSLMDTALDDAEVAVIAAIPGAHSGRQWLIDNQDVSRRVLELVEAKRREAL